MYHQIAATPPKGTPYRSLVVKPADFKRQMWLLKISGYTGLSMQNLLPYLKAEKKGKVFGLTFDDGYLNNLTNALPILQQFGFTSTCYVVSQMLGKTNLWDQPKGIPQTPLMDIAQLRQWAQAGQEVGAHTQNHVHLNSLQLSDAAQEIQGSKTDLEQMLGLPVGSFCYPYGQYSPEHIGQVDAAGYQTATTTQRGNCGILSDLLELPRITVARSTTLPVVFLKVATHYETWKSSQ
jgi:peptidoglycan/xylan/chitin deacetylase (PgdA/CDA1 family)